MSATFQICKKTRNAVILNLRRIFATDPIYTYVETVTGEYDFDLTRIVISDAIPMEHVFFPAITVQAVSGDEQRYLGPDSLKETKTGGVVSSDQKFSSIPMTVTINIHTIDDTIARDQITDRIYDQFKLITTDLAANGVEIARTRFSPDRRTFNGDRWYITATLTMEIYTEWKDDLLAAETVTSIPITISLIP